MTLKGSIEHVVIQGFPLSEISADDLEVLQRERFGTLRDVQAFLLNDLGFPIGYLNRALQEKDGEVIIRTPFLIQVSEQAENSHALRIARGFKADVMSDQPNVHLEDLTWDDTNNQKKIRDFIGYVRSKLGHTTQYFVYNDTEVFTTAKNTFPFLAKTKGTYAFHPDFINRIAAIHGSTENNSFATYNQTDVSEWEKFRLATDDSHRRMAECLKSSLKPGDRVLDVGAGTGGVEEHFLDDDTGARFWCVDGTPAMLNELRAKSLPHVKGISLCTLDPKFTFPFPDNTFNHVVCNGVVPYLDGTTFKRLVEEIHRVLIPQGEVCLSFQATPDNRDGDFVKKYHANKQGVVTNIADTFEHASRSYFYRLGYVSRILLQAGFTFNGNIDAPRRYSVHQTQAFMSQISTWYEQKNGNVISVDFRDVIGAFDCQYTYVTARKVYIGRSCC